LKTAVASFDAALEQVEEVIAPTLYFSQPTLKSHDKWIHYGRKFIKFCYFETNAHSLVMHSSNNATKFLV